MSKKNLEPKPAPDTPEPKAVGGGAQEQDAPAPQTIPERSGLTRVRSHPSQAFGTSAERLGGQIQQRQNAVESMAAHSRRKLDEKNRAANEERLRTHFDPNQKDVYFLRCPVDDDHIAAFFTGRPGSKMPKGEQVDTSYSPAGQPLVGPLLCQVCYAQGRQTEVTYADRLIESMTSDEYADLMEGGTRFLERRDRDRAEQEERNLAEMTHTPARGMGESVDLLSAAALLAGTSPQIKAALESDQAASRAQGLRRQADTAEARGDFPRAEQLRSEAEVWDARSQEARWTPDRYPVEVHPLGVHAEDPRGSEVPS